MKFMLNRIQIRIFTIFAFLMGFLSVSAQPPQLIPYQAIARDNTGNPVLNQNIGLRFSIHDQTIAGAAFDVFSDEPPQDRELLALPNFLATPHIGGSAEEAILAMGIAAIDGLDTAVIPTSL
jgi:D-3-phosphoglycerate dehydrogenase